MDLSNKVFEIISLIAILCSVYLLSIEVERYSESTNVATYQKLNSDISNLHLKIHTEPYLRRVVAKRDKDGIESLSNEQKDALYAVQMTLLRITEVAYTAWNKQIISDKQMERFAFGACTAFQGVSENKKVPILVTENYITYLETICDQ